MQNYSSHLVKNKRKIAPFWSLGASHITAPLYIFWHCYDAKIWGFQSAKQGGRHMYVSDQLSCYKMPTLTSVWQGASPSASVIGSASGDTDVTHLLFYEAPPLRVHYCLRQLRVHYCLRQLRLSTVVFCCYRVYSIKFSCCLAVRWLVNTKLGLKAIAFSKAWWFVSPRLRDA